MDKFDNSDIVEVQTEDEQWIEGTFIGYTSHGCLSVVETEGFAGDIELHRVYNHNVRFGTDGSEDLQNEDI